VPYNGPDRRAKRNGNGVINLGNAKWIVIGLISVSGFFVRSWMGDVNAKLAMADLFNGRLMAVEAVQKDLVDNQKDILKAVQSLDDKVDYYLAGVTRPPKPADPPSKPAGRK
jgi:hypothetical protein